MTLEKRLRSQLTEIESKGLTRSLKSPDGVDLSSNDYLGLAADQRIRDAFIEGVKNEGVGSTGSRLLRGERECFRRVEEQFAKWKGAEASLYFATGYQANIGLMQTFLEPDDRVFSDELNHASLIDGIRLAKARKTIFSHCDSDQLERLLGETACKGQKFLITESLFSMDGDIAPLERYADICRRTNTNLIVDEAHSVGLYGACGSGLIEELGLERDVFLSINTTGKALGVSGAFVAGSRLAVDYLINRCRSFIFSTAPVPAIAIALKIAIEIAANESERRENLQKLCHTFCNLLLENGLEVPADETQIIPVVVGSGEKAVKIAEALQSAGFDIRAIRPPTVAEGTSRLRISLNVNLTEEVLKEFAGILKKELNR